MRPLLPLWTLAVVSACDTPEAPPAAPAETACAQAGTYASVGQPFLLTYCTSCHARGVVGEDRHGAPDAVRLDTLADARATAERIRARVADGSMPPATRLDPDVQARMLAWLACGTPGEENPLPEHPGSFTGESYLLQVFVEEDAEYPSTVVLRRVVEGGVRGFSEERYRLEPDGASLVSLLAVDEAGDTAFELELPAGLPLFEPGEHRLDVTRGTPTGRDTAEETWFVENRSDAELRDPHEVESELVEVVATSAAGEELGWHFTATRSISAAWVDLDGQSWEAFQTGADFALASDAPFPVEVGWSWVEAVIAR